MIRDRELSFQTVPLPYLSTGWGFQPSGITTNADTDGPGVWRTTDEGNRIFIKGGEARAGGPNGPVISAPSKKKKKTSKPTSKPAASKTPKKVQAKPPVADSPPEKPVPPQKKEAEAPTLPAAEPFKTKLQFGPNFETHFDDFRSMEEMVEGEGMEEDEAEKLINRVTSLAQKKLGPDWQKKIGTMAGAPEGTEVWIYVNPDGGLQCNFSLYGPDEAGASTQLVEGIRSFDLKCLIMVSK
jgi:hypothetical protein